MMLPTPVRRLEAAVDCGTCRACCYQVVALRDEETGYDLDDVATSAGVLRVLRRRRAPAT